MIASRSSATFLPEKSSPRAAAAAVSPVCFAVFCAVCWRPRAFPPAFAARLRAVLLPLLDDDLLAPPGFRALDVERRLVELREDDDDFALELRPRPPDPPLAADLRAPPPEELDDDLRPPDALDLRALEARELELRELELRELDDALEDLRPPLELRELDPRALDPRALELDDLRVDPLPLDDLFRDDPPPLPEPDSAISLFLL